MTTLIDNAILNNDRGGVLFSFAEKAGLRPSEASNDYTRLSSYRVPKMGCRPYAYPQTVDFFHLEDGPDILAKAITIKMPSSFDLGLPRSYSFAAEAAVAMAEDLLTLRP